jgi:hypothetical protein
MKQATLVRLFLLGLPIGLTLLGSIGVFLHARKIEDPPVVKREEGINRKGITEADLRFFVQRLAGDIGPRPAYNLQATRRTLSFLEGLVGETNFGYKMVHRKAFRSGEYDAVNLEVELPGTLAPQDILVIGAHYDTANLTPGANANASGVAATLALAQAWVGQPQHRTVRFVFFGQGEAPHAQTPTMGSAAYAKEARQRDENIVMMVDLNSLGCYRATPQASLALTTLGLPNTGDYLALSGPGALESAKQLEQTADFPVRGVAQSASPWTSDVASFGQENFPALLVTDTAHLRNPHHHQLTDTPEQIDYAVFTRVVQALERWLRSLANPTVR